MLLFNCNLINPNPIMQNPRIIIGIDVNKEYTERIDVSETPKTIRIPPIIKSLVFILVPNHENQIQYSNKRKKDSNSR